VKVDSYPDPFDEFKLIQWVVIQALLIAHFDSSEADCTFLLQTVSKEILPFSWLVDDTWCQGFEERFVGVLCRWQKTNEGCLSV